MFSTSSEQYASSRLSPPEQTNHVLFFEPHHQPDNVDIQSLPSLMSPNPSSKDLSDSADDDDEEMNEYSGQHFHIPYLEDKSTLLPAIRPLRPSLAESGLYLSPLQPSTPYPVQYPTCNLLPAVGLGNDYPQLQFQQRQQVAESFQHPQLQIQQQPLQSQQHGSQFLPQHQPLYPPYIPHIPPSPQFITTVHSTPSISPYGPCEPAMQAQVYRGSTSLQYYLASMENHPQPQFPMDLSFQRPALQNTAPSLEQSIDMLMASHVDGSSNAVESYPLLMSSSGSSLVQSPTMSWISVSRETSPAPAPVSVVVSRRSTFRSSKKRSGSKIPRSKSSHASGVSTSESRAPPTPAQSTPWSTSNVRDISNNSAQVFDESSSSTGCTPATRRRRVRQIKIKMKPTSFECDAPDCGKVFSRAYNLTSHMKTHSTERPFLCGSCPLAFARRHDRERHVRLHTGEKPYSCEICSSGFMRNDALHRHQRICGQSSTELMTPLDQQQQQHY